jgi:hypothetical protein
VGIAAAAKSRSVNSMRTRSNLVAHPGGPAGAGPLLSASGLTLRFGGADQVFHVGSGSVAVPGCLAGYLAVHDIIDRKKAGSAASPAEA